MGEAGEQARQKLETVRADLHRIRDQVIPDLVLNLEVDDEGGTNPADTRMINDYTIRVRIRQWFLEMATVGEILSMVSHELGVHNLANEEMTAEELQNEEEADENEVVVGVGEREFRLGPYGDNENGRQKDHVNVGKGAAGNNVSTPRTRRYVATMLRLGDSIEGDDGRDDEAKIRDQRDMLQSFLFDIARIIVFDDQNQPVQVFRGADDVALVMNWFRNQVVDDHAEDHDWLEKPELNVDSTAWGVRGTLLGALGRYAKSRAQIGFGNLVGSVGRGLAGAANRVGGFFRGVGNFLGGLIPGNGYQPVNQEED